MRVHHFMVAHIPPIRAHSLMTFHHTDSKHTRTIMIQPYIRPFHRMCTIMTIIIHIMHPIMATTCPVTHIHKVECIPCRVWWTMMTNQKTPIWAAAGTVTVAQHQQWHPLIVELANIADDVQISNNPLSNFDSILFCREKKRDFFLENIWSFIFYFSFIDIGELAFRFLGVDTDGCRRRFVCELDFRARSNPITRLAFTFIG